MDSVAVKREDVNSMEQPAVALDNDASAVDVAVDDKGGEGSITPPSPLGPALMPEPASEPSSAPGHESMTSLVAFDGGIVITDQVD